MFSLWNMFFPSDLTLQFLLLFLYLNFLFLMILMWLLLVVLILSLPLILFLHNCLFNHLLITVFLSLLFQTLLHIFLLFMCLLKLKSHLLGLKDFEHQAHSNASIVIHLHPLHFNHFLIHLTLLKVVQHPQLLCFQFKNLYVIMKQDVIQIKLNP